MSVTFTTSPCCESSFCRFVLRVSCIKIAAERVEGSGSIVEFDSCPQHKQRKMLSRDKMDDESPVVEA